jgi:hypothetical protein
MTFLKKLTWDQMFLNCADPTASLIKSTGYALKILETPEVLRRILESNLQRGSRRTCPGLQITAGN